MRSLVLVLAGLLVSCGSDGTGPDALTASQVSGIWDVSMTGCLGGTLPMRLVAERNGDLTSAQNAWTNNEAQLGFSRPLEGSVTLSSGAAEIHLFADANHVAALLFVGTLTADGHLSGTMTDPMPGFQPVVHLSTDPPCEAAAAGSKR